MYEDPQQASPPRGPRWPEGQTPPPVQPPSAQYAQQPKSGGPLKGCMIALGVVVACGLLLVFVLVMLAIVGGAQIVGVSTVDSGVRLEEVVVSGSSVSPKVACIPIQGIIQGSSMPGMESSPVAAVSRGPMESVSAGSTNAVSAYPAVQSMLVLRPSSSHSDAQRVTSLPVPAVVGTMTRRTFRSKRRPASQHFWKAPMSDMFPHRTAMHLAASSGEPPPTPTMLRMPSLAATAAPSSITSAPGLTGTSEKS